MADRFVAKLEDELLIYTYQVENVKDLRNLIIGECNSIRNNFLKGSQDSEKNIVVIHSTW